MKLLFNLREQGVAKQAHATMSAYIQDLIRERRKNPGEDVLSHYATTEVDGRSYTDEGLSDAIRFIYPAAGENTMNALGTLLYYVLSLPDVYERVRANPDDRTAAIEESLRIRSSVQYMLRYIDKPLTIDGFEIPANSYLLLANSSANRDPTRFENPTKFSLDRGFNNHISFGKGPNFCLGAHLARAGRCGPCSISSSPDLRDYGSRRMRRSSSKGAPDTACDLSTSSLMHCGRPPGLPEGALSIVSAGAERAWCE